MTGKRAFLFDNDPARSISVLVNLLPLVGVLFLNWDPHRVFVVYCLETIIIGFFTVIKMLLVGLAQQNHLWNDTPGNRVNMPTLGFVLFFIAHYGFFVAVQTGIFFGVASIGNISPISGYRELFHYLHNRELLIMLGTFAAGYLVSDLGAFIANRSYEKEPMMLVMFTPYGRIVVQQFVVILGGFFLNLFPGAVFMCVFVIVKIYVEQYLRFDVRIREEFMKRADPLSNKK